MAEGVSQSTIDTGVKNVGPEHTESVNKLVDDGILPESMRTVEPKSLWEKLWNGQKPESPDFVENVYNPSKILEEIDILHASELTPGLYSIYVENSGMTFVPIAFDPNFAYCSLGDGISGLKKQAPQNCYGMIRIGLNPTKTNVELFKDISELPELEKYAG